MLGREKDIQKTQPGKEAVAKASPEASCLPLALVLWATIPVQAFLESQHTPFWVLSREVGWAVLSL